MTALRKNIRIFDPQQQQGAALVIAVLILLVLTVVGIYAVTTSTLETKIAGSERVLQEAFHAADGGVDYGRHVIELFLTSNDPDLPDGASVDENAFRAEILGTNTGDPPSVEAEIGKCDMEIKVERIKAEEATGYPDEFGLPASEKQITIYYLVDSKSSGTAGASSEIEANYRRVVE
jgi:Tfp pilus assembly protein PilX